MKKVALLVLIGLVSFLSPTIAQNVMSSTDVATNYPGTSAVQPAPGKIGKWYKTSRMSWSTSQFKCYIYNGMAYRLRFPNNYNPADTVTKYPMIVFFHGGGEIAPITDNEYQLLWGAKDFQDSINAGKFNAFMLFPQVTNIGWDYTYYERVNTVLDTLKKYNNLDEDKVISMGLSNGGFAALSYSIFFPRRPATVIAASPALISIFTPEQKQYFTHIPLFITSGGLDTNPEPGDVRKFVDTFAAKGGNVRYILYPTLGHLTWQQQWASGYMVDYWTSAHKANPLIFFQKSVFCPDSLPAVKLGITSGFPEYEWQKDQVSIPGSNANEINVNAFGSYRVRFRRIANGPWSAWSPEPAVISPKPAEATPDIVVTGLKSKVLPAPDGSTTVPLELPFGSLTYEWRRVSDNVLVSNARTFDAPVGQYKGKIAGCSRTYSNIFTVVNANGTPKPDAALSLVATRASTEAINLSWTLSRITLGNPTAYEIYRSSISGGPLTLVAIQPGSLKTYTDTLGVNANTNFFYKVRAVNDVAAAALSNEAGSAEGVPPTTPTNLTVLNTSRSFVTLNWSPATDNIGIAAYDVYVGGVKKYTTTETSITADSLNGSTTYSFTVRARDLSGNLSAASNAVSSTTAALGNGLKYRFYQGSWTVLPNFNNLTPAKTGTSATIDLAVRTLGVDDNFGFVWEGYLVVPTTGSYTFELGSDDGSKMYLDKFYSPDATAFINSDGAHAETPTVSKTVTLTAGSHPVAFTYFEITGGQVMNVYYTGPGITRRLIPASAFSEPAPVLDVTEPTAPASLVATYIDRTSVTLKWNASTDAVGVTGYNIYRNNVPQYTTTGAALTAVADSLDPNTAYTFTVKARDAAGNLSTPSNALAVTTKSVFDGLNYKYYEGSWDSLPNFNLLTPIKTGNTPDINIGIRNAGVNDNFGFVWEGYLNILTSGVYTFELESDDGSKFYWNTLYNPAATPLVTNDYLHANFPTESKSISVAAGTYPVSITFFEKTFGESMKLYWTGPGIPRQAIPASAFIATTVGADAIAPTTPANLRVTNITKTTATVSWDNSTDNVGVAGYDFYVNGLKKTIILGNSVALDTLTPGANYLFKVQARDAAGNLSGMSTEVSATTATVSNKFSYKYYEGSFDALPNFDLLTPVKIGNTANVDLSVRPAGVNDNFAFLWEGKITIPTAGTYTFETASDDGSKFYINTPYSPTATALVNNDFLHAETLVSKSITLTAGVYPVAISFFEKTGAEVMKVYWTGPGIARQLIPDAAFADPTSVADVTPPTVPANFKTTYTGRTFIDLSWDNSTDAVGVAGYNVFVNGSATPLTTTLNKITVSNLTPNTSYTFKVQARDADNNLSGFATLTANSTASGLRYKYYEGNWDALPNFNTLIPVKTGTSANIDLSPRNIDDYFAFVWEGYITIPNTGSYTFELSSDDGSKFYFNSLYDPNATPLVSFDGLHIELPTVAATRTITAGIYPVAITYFEKTGGQNMKLYWTGPGIVRQEVPGAAFTQNFTATVASLITGTGIQGVSTTGVNTAEHLAVSGADMQKALKIKAYPNPFVDKLQVQFNNTAAGNHISATIYDLNGRTILNKDFGALAAGANVLTVNTGTDVKPGVYMVRLNINGVPSGMWKMIKEKQ